MRKTPLIFIGLAIVLVVGFGYSMQATSSTEFCMSCHEMERYKFELEHSSHAKDADEKPIQCKQCHLPPSFGVEYLAVKSYQGISDIYAHLFHETEDLNRRLLQHKARRFVVDDACLACHEDLTKDVDGEPISLAGKVAHESWQGKDGNGRRTCAGCHQNMAHLPEFDRRYEVNAEFAKKLPPPGAEETAEGAAE